MRTVLRLVALTTAVVVAAWFIARIPGAFSIDIAGYTLQTSPPVGLVLGGLLFLAIYVLARTVATIGGLPGAFRRGGAARARRRGEAAVHRGLTALAVRDGGEARREASRARRLLGDTPQTLLIAAYAASIDGREDEAEAAFRALSERADGAFMGLRGLMRQAMARQDWAAAAALARRAEADQPAATWLRAERAHLAIRLGEWGHAAALTEDPHISTALQVQAAAGEADPAVKLKLARDAFRRNSTLTAAALAYAAALSAAGKRGRADVVLRDAWTANPHPDLAEAALTGIAEPGARLRAAGSLTKYLPDHPETQLLLARLSLAAGQPAQARIQAEAARRGMNQLRVHRLLAEIDGAEGVGAEQQSAALRRASAADADPVWVCETCGSVHGEWHAACPVCHTAGRVRWAVPSGRAVSLPAMPVEEISGLILPPSA